MIRLFLEDQEVELNESVSFAITKQFEDITSPADIKNDWSKSVNIPFTKVNNKIFGNIFNVDRLIVSDGSSLMGLYFDPYKKISFRLQWGDAILMQGYAKNLNVTKESNGQGHYTLTLNGELGKVFQEMKKITFDRTTDEPQYLIDGSKYVNEIINKDLIYDLWRNAGGVNTTLYENTSQYYKLEEIIGFIPNNSYDNDFDYKTFQKKNSELSMSFVDVLNEKANTIKSGTSYVDYTGIEAETIIGSGLLPREIGEYRSYMQIPYIFFNKLFQIFIKKTEEITDYKVELDNSWFIDVNPYWSKLVYILEKFQTKAEFDSHEDNSAGFTLLNSNLRTGSNDVPVLTYPYTYSPSTIDTQWVTYSGIEYNKLKTEYENGNVDGIWINQEVPIAITLTNPRNTDRQTIGDANTVFYWGPNAQAIIVFELLDGNGNHVAYSRSKVYGNDFVGDRNTEGYYGSYAMPSVRHKSGRVWEQTVKAKMNFYIDRDVVGNSFSIRIKANYNLQPYNGEMLSRYPEQAYFINSFNTDNIVVFDNVKIQLAEGAKITYTTSDVIKRTNSSFTLNDLWNNEYNVFDEILNYCKQFRIGIFCDYANKKLLFKPLSQYFREYKILDWTDKLDMSKEYHIQPITFENKYVLFNYEKYETELNKLYNEKYGKNFGEFKLSTDYEFNTDEKDLFKYSKVTIPSTDMCLSWTNLYDNMAVMYTLPAEITAYNKDKDEKNVDVFGSLLFYKGITAFDNTSAMRNVKITDDTYLQSLNQTYFYTQDGDANKSISVGSYPQLDIVYGDKLCTFGIPAENYTYLKNSYNNTKGIYNVIWEKYLNERYSKQNKIVTCHLRLTPYDMVNFSYNNFVQIENQLYMVNKIYDYQIDENISTKVDLITIQNINGYTDDNNKVLIVYNDDKQEWRYYSDWITLTTVGETATIYVTSNTGVNWYSENNSLSAVRVYYNNDESNSKVGSGTIPAGAYIPVTFKMTALEDQFGDVVFTNGLEEVRVNVGLVVSKTFTVFDSDYTVWTSSDKVELQNTSPLEKTIYISSTNSEVNWQEINGTALQDMYISYNNDRTTEKAGSGTIPAGSFVPVTFRMDKEGDVSTINGTIRFSTAHQTTDVPVRLIYNEVFTVYRWDGAVWDEENDYILLERTNQTKTIYLTANSDVDWSDESAELHNLWINAGGDAEDWGEYENGSGTIYAPSNYKPIHFRLDTDGMETGSSGNVILFNGRHEWIIPVRLASLV